MRFRDEIRTPLTRFLKRPAVRRREPEAIKAIMADPKKMAMLESDIDQMAGRNGFRRRYMKAAEEGQPQEGRFLRFFLDNQDQIFALIARIMALFGGSLVPSVAGMSWTLNTAPSVSSDVVVARLKKPKRRR